MTQLDVLYRYGVPPTEPAILALSKVREVYGIRRLAIDERARTVRVEYDSSRLNAPLIHQLLRRAGLDIVEIMPMYTLPEPTPNPAVIPTTDPTTTTVAK